MSGTEPAERAARRGVGSLALPAPESPGAAGERLVKRSGRLAPVAVALVVVLGYAPQLLHPVGSNPMASFSGLFFLRGGALPGYWTIDPNAGFTTQALGHRAALDWLHGAVPWWNPYEGVGTPLAGEMQSASFFPPVLLFLLPPGHALFELTLALAAGLGTYGLLRQLGVSPWASSVGGSLFGLCGTFAWLTNAAANPVALLPLSLLAVERLACSLAPRAPETVGGLGDGRLQERRSRPMTAAGSTPARGGALEEATAPGATAPGASGPGSSGLGPVALLGATMALSLYAGFPETAFIDGLLVGAWALLRLLQARGRERLRLVLGLALGGLLALLLAAPILVAFGDYLRFARVGGHGGAFAHASLPSIASSTFGLPYLFGPLSAFASADPTGKLGQMWGGVGGYLGPAVMLAAFAGLIATRRRMGLRVLLGAWCIVALGKTFDAPVMTAAVNLVPFISSAAFYRYAPPTWELAASILAALAVDAAATGQLERRRLPLALAAWAGALGAALLLALPTLRLLQRSAPHFRAYLWGSVLWSAAMGTAVVAGLTLGRARAGRLVLHLAVVLDALVLFVFPSASMPRKGRLDVPLVSYLRSHVGSARIATLGPLAPNYGSYFGIPEVNVNDLPYPSSWGHYVTTYLDPNTSPIVFTGTVSLAPGGLTPRAALVRGVARYEAVGVRDVVVPSGTPGLGRPGVSGALGIPGARVAYRDSLATVVRLASSSALLAAPGCRVAGARAGQTGVQGVVSCPRQSSLTLRELWAPGWSATFDGRRVPLRRSGELFQRAALPGGRGLVRFRYRPPHETLALGALVLGALGSIALAIAGPLGRTRGARSPLR